jgi:SH3 domain-containing YSC84-like protein 1
LGRAAVLMGQSGINENGGTIKFAARQPVFTWTLSLDYWYRCAPVADEDQFPRECLPMSRNLFFRSIATAALGWLALVGPPLQSSAQSPEFMPTREDAVVRSSAVVLNEIMGIPLSGIPASMLADAHAVAIVPNVLKGGFVVGARYGRGVLLVRDEAQQWRAPVFITLTGGNIGWQAGVQATDVILVFRTRRSVDGILAGKFTIGADAAAAAGPVGRQAAAATDRHMTAEILSYSRSRGLFAGVSLDGSVMQIDHLATGSYYSSFVSGQATGAPEVVVPEAARQLTAMVASYAASNAVEFVPGTVEPLVVQPLVVQEVDVLRGQLAQASAAMYDLVDDSWRAYLALPTEVYAQSAHPPAEALRASLARFDAVAADQRYQALAGRAEFQSVHTLLKNYFRSLTAAAAPLQLPPPPGTPAG